MSESAHITLTTSVGAAAAVVAILLYFRFAVRPNVRRQCNIRRCPRVLRPRVGASWWTASVAYERGELP